MKNLLAFVLFAMVAGCVEAENSESTSEFERGTDEYPYCSTDFSEEYCEDSMIGMDIPWECSEGTHQVIIWNEMGITHARWSETCEEVCLSACEKNP